MKAYFMKNTDNWATPKKIYKIFMKNGYIDPCPLNCKQNNLGKKYNNAKLYINPPFSQLAKWIDYIIELEKLNNEIVLLMPARTDTKYFHKLLKETNPIITFIKGRLKFNDGKTSAPFPTILIYINKKNIFPLYNSIEFIQK